MSGIPLAWAQDGDGDWWYVDADAAHPATHIARPVPEDEAREAVIAAARALASPRTLGLTIALDRLDALGAS
jgi:hypothetical protein